VPDRLRRHGTSFPVDVEDGADEFVVTAELPGLRTQDFDVFARGNAIRIVADYGEDEGTGQHLRQERARGRVERTIRLPERIDGRRVSASYVNGLLRVTAKKRHPSTRIEVE